MVFPQPLGRLPVLLWWRGHSSDLLLCLDGAGGQGRAWRRGQRRRGGFEGRWRRGGAAGAGAARLGCCRDDGGNVAKPCLPGSESGLDPGLHSGGERGLRVDLVLGVAIWCLAHRLDKGGRRAGKRGVEQELRELVAGVVVSIQLRAEDSVAPPHELRAQQHLRHRQADGLLWFGEEGVGVLHFHAEGAQVELCRGQL